MTLEKIAKNLISAELLRQDINKQQLAQLLTDAGYKSGTVQNVTNKINNGTYSVVFLLQCMKALGVKNISLDDLYRE